MRNLCLFAHFDKDDRVDDYVFWYLNKIRELDFSIVFISTSRLSVRDIERLRGTCTDVILRENAGLDFGSWAAGFAKHGSDIGGRLLLANDSVYGPIGDLRAALDRLTSEQADFYGMVESREIAPHLQSWFLLFEPNVVHHGAFRQMLEQPFPAMAKRQIILRGEVGLSRQLVTAGFRYRALCKNQSFGALPARHAMNPMLLFWREILFECGIPFLKVELLRDNPLGVENSVAILQSIDRIAPEWGGVINSHLERTRNSHSWRGRRRPLPVRLGYALIRERHRLKRENRRALAVGTTILLESFMAPRAMWRWLKPFFFSGQTDFKIANKGQ